MGWIWWLKVDDFCVFEFFHGCDLHFCTMIRWNRSRVRRRLCEKRAIGISYSSHKRGGFFCLPNLHSTDWATGDEVDCEEHPRRETRKQDIYLFHHSVVSGIRVLCRVFQPTFLSRGYYFRPCSPWGSTIGIRIGFPTWVVLQLVPHLNFCHMLHHEGGSQSLCTFILLCGRVPLHSISPID